MLVNYDAANGGATTPAAKVCGNCGVDGHKILHNIRHRGIFRRLCTSCVLRLHPQSFCPTCFVVYQTPVVPNSVVTCVKCYSSSHPVCVGPMQQPRYYCPLCVSPNEPIFALKKSRGGDLGIAGGEVVIDQRDARILVAAAMISSVSMNEAEVAARAVAERRAKDAAITRKRAMQALDYMAALASREKMKKIESLPGPAVGVGSGISQLKGNVCSGVTERLDGYGYGRSGNRKSDVVAGVRFEEKKQVIVGGHDRSNEVITSALNACSVVGRRSNEVHTIALNNGSVVDRSSKEVVNSALNDGTVVDRSSIEVLTSTLNDGSVVDRSLNVGLTSALSDGSVVDRRSNEVLASAVNAVELRGHAGLGGVVQQGSGVSELSTSGCVAMDVDEQRGTNSGSAVEVVDSAVQDHDGMVLYERSSYPVKSHGVDLPRDFVNNGVVLHPPKEDLMEGVVSGNPMKSIESTDLGQNENDLQH